MDAQIWAAFLRVTDGKEPLERAVSPAGAWMVNRVYVACHGIRARDIPVLAMRYGWPRAGRENAG